MALLDHLNRVSPLMCRFLARKAAGRRPKSNADIARDGGLSRATVAKVSQLDRWDGVSISTADAFARGCGVDLLSPSRRRDQRLVARGKLALVMNSSPSQRKMFARILGQLRIEGSQHDPRGMSA